ncbi:unnamed protein product [Leptidea sinapis]|uniref:Cuticle protein n=1 Tax=Leptidea sinapis TaxID=189913 RepID=A0A5E4QKR8_9NEOP|nr:unnamed protein product [Leptidea sinapis]
MALLLESLKIAKTAPTDSGFNITPAPARNVNRGTPRFSTTTKLPPTLSTTLAPPYAYPREGTITATPSPYPDVSSTPIVEVSPNSVDTTRYNFRPTVSPITADEASSTASRSDFDLTNTNTIDNYFASDSSSYGRVDVYNPNSYRHANEWSRRQQPAARFGDGYTPQFSSYDGVAFRRNGFRYYLPKQYHEEQSDSDEKTGSFGYVDPFGIRRVIYYNSSPGRGFQVRKNNRYVGHDATPYDPRPIDK